MTTAAPPSVCAEPFCFAELLDQRASEEGLRKGERTRRRVEAAAARLLEAHGYHDLRMSDVADEAGLSHGAVYRYFENKKEISLAVLEHYCRHSHERLLAAGEEGSVYERIRAATRFFVENFAKNVGLGRCIRQLSDELPEFRELWIRANSDWYGVVARSLQRHADAASTTATQSPSTQRVALDVAHACGAMVDEMVHDVFVRQDPSLAHYRSDPGALGDLLALLWYRAAYANNPDEPEARRQAAFGLRIQD